MSDLSATHGSQPAKPGKPGHSKRSTIWTWVIAILLVPMLVFGIRSCYVAEGAYHSAKAPKLEFIGAAGGQDGVPTFREDPIFELAFQPTDSRRAFVEILTDAQYEKKSKESYVGGWGQNQGYWGGLIADARIVAGKSLVQLKSGQVAPGKYWVRTALFAGNTHQDRDSSFDRVMYSLVGKPIDYKDGYYFMNENGINRRYYASRYYPFYVLPAAVGLLPNPVVTVGSQHRSDGKKDGAGVFRFALPAGFRPVSAEKYQAIKKTMVQKGTELARSSGVADPTGYTVGDLWAYESEDSKYILVFVSSEEKDEVRETDVRKSNTERVEWGKKAGQLLGNSRVEDGPKIDGHQVLFTEIFMRPGPGRMQSYDVFVNEQPKYRHTITVIYDGAAFDDKMVTDFLSSITIEVASK